MGAVGCIGSNGSISLETAGTARFTISVNGPPQDLLDQVPERNQNRT